MAKGSSHRSAVIAGLARDCGVFLPSVLANIERIAELYDQTAFLFLENDSSDDTRTVLAAWCSARPNARTVSLDGLLKAYPARTVRLAVVRNRCIEEVRAHYPGYSHLILLDCDGVNAGPIDMSAFRKARNFLDTTRDCAGVFANSTSDVTVSPEGRYLDLWAFRHPKLCPADPWEEMLDYMIGHGVSSEAAFAATYAKRLFSLAPDSPPLEVDSAFGGLGIYKLDAALRSRRGYVGFKEKTVPFPGGTREAALQICEHVSFNKGIRGQKQRLFVLPYLKNGIGLKAKAEVGFAYDCLFELAMVGPLGAEGPRGALRPPASAAGGR